MEERKRLEIAHSDRRRSIVKGYEYHTDASPDQLEKKYIEGPSIRFAEEMIRSWGNVKVQCVTIYEDDHKRISLVNVVDLQKNISYSKQITIVKTVERKKAKDREVISERLNSYGDRIFIVVATDDEVNNKEAALISKEIRNSSLRLIPQDIIDESIKVTEETIKAGVSSDMKGARKAILDSFATIGVKPKDIEEYIGHGIDTVSPEEIVDLRAVYKTIADGQATWKAYVDKEEGPAKKDVEKAELGGDSASEMGFGPGKPEDHQDVKAGAKKK